MFTCLRVGGYVVITTFSFYVEFSLFPSDDENNFKGMHSNRKFRTENRPNSGRQVPVFLCLLSLLNDDEADKGKARVDMRADKTEKGNKNRIPAKPHDEWCLSPVFSSPLLYSVLVVLVVQVF